VPDEFVLIVGAVGLNDHMMVEAVDALIVPMLNLHPLLMANSAK